MTARPEHQAHRPQRSESLIRRLAIHEASHALTRLCLALDTVTEITIEAPHGGYVNARTDVYPENTSEVLSAHLCLMLTGRAGEEVFLKSIGANNNGESVGSDIEVATKLAYDMETSMGVGQKMPLLFRRCKDWAHHLATNAELAADVNKRLEGAYEEALKLVRKQAAAIDYVYGELLRHGTLKGLRLETVLGEARRLIQP